MGLALQWAVVLAEPVVAVVHAETENALVFVVVDTVAQRLLDSALTTTEGSSESGMQQAVKPAPAQSASQSDSSPPTVLESPSAH